VHRYEKAGTYVIRQTITGPRGTVTQAQRVFAGGEAEPVRAEYYENEQDTTPAVVQNEYALQFDWSDGASALPVAAAGFAARFAVEITPRFSEIYDFTMRSHDKVRVLLDGKPLIDAWEPDGSGQATGSTRLVAGRKYELTVQYVKSSDTPALTVSWESDSQGSFIVPRSAKAQRRRAVSPP
jgi:mannan endo-1,4-beta-mannosidase